MTRKKASNKSCSELNFSQKKSVSAYVYLLQSGARRLMVKYYIVLKPANYLIIIKKKDQIKIV